jgi:hypothetical protein
MLRPGRKGGDCRTMRDATPPVHANLSMPPCGCRTADDPSSHPGPKHIAVGILQPIVASRATRDKQ